MSGSAQSRSWASSAPGSVTLMGPVSGLWTQRQLIWQLSKREVLSRYRGSLMGIAWSVLTPLLMLGVYTFVFSEVFKSRWPGTQAVGTAEFSIMLFAGLIVYGLFAECVNRAPGLVLGHANYVKKVVFPIEILPWVAMSTAMFNALSSTFVLLLGIWAVRGSVPATALLIPFVIAPLVLITLGLSFFLSATGVFYRDLGHSIGLITTVLLFMSPVFYPVSSLPTSYQAWVALNPLTYVIEETRNVLINGYGIQWNLWVLYTMASYAVAYLGYWWFQKTRKGFADVL
jgi:lipopolysaccharide transport system permease protein